MSTAAVVEHIRAHRAGLRLAHDPARILGGACADELDRDRRISTAECIEQRTHRILGQECRVPADLSLALRPRDQIGIGRRRRRAEDEERKCRPEGAAAEKTARHGRTIAVFGTFAATQASVMIPGGARAQSRGRGGADAGRVSESWSTFDVRRRC